MPHLDRFLPRLARRLERGRRQRDGGLKTLEKKIAKRCDMVAHLRQVQQLMHVVAREQRVVKKSA